MGYERGRLFLRLLAWSAATIVPLWLVLQIGVAPKIEAMLLAEKQATVRSVVESAVTVIQSLHERSIHGEISAEQAKAEAIRLTTAARYGSNDYLWINDLEPRMVTHPMKPEMNGMSLTDFTDPAGKRLFVEMVRECMLNGSGFVDYQWPRPGDKLPVPKISFVKQFDPWQWVIGSGIYVDDVKEQIASLNRWFSFLAGILVAIAAGISLLFSGSLWREIARLRLGDESRQSDSAPVSEQEAPDPACLHPDSAKAVDEFTEAANQLLKLWVAKSQR